MTEQQAQSPIPETQTPEQEAPKASARSLAEELSRLGQNFSELIKEVLEAPQLQEVRKEVTSGAQNMIEEINEAIVKAREAPITQEVAQKAASAVEEIKTAPVTENLRVGLLKTLRSVNEELNEIIAKMESASQESASEQATSEQEAASPSPDQESHPA